MKDFKDKEKNKIFVIFVCFNRKKIMAKIKKSFM